VVTQDDVSILARKDGPAAQEHAVTEADPPVAGALRVENHEIVDHHAVSELDLRRVA
jgi:hypothetical protein